VTAISRLHDLWVRTAEFHRGDIERALAASPGLRGRVRFIYIPHRWWHYQPTPLWRLIEGSIAKPVMNRAYVSNHLTMLPKR